LVALKQFLFNDYNKTPSRLKEEANQGHKKKTGLYDMTRLARYRIHRAEQQRREALLHTS